MKTSQKWIPVLLCLILSIILTSCNSQNSFISTPSNKTTTNHIEPSIVYKFFSANLTRVAKYYMDYTLEYVTQEEYETHSDSISEKWFPKGTFLEDKHVSAYSATLNHIENCHASFEELTHCEGKTFYIVNNGKYAKVTYNELVLAYLNIVFLEDDTILLSQYINKDKDIESSRVKTDSYVIEFFYEN